MVEYRSREELVRWVQGHTPEEEPVMHVGAGSNLLFVKDYNGTILHSRIADIERMTEVGDKVFVRVGGGMTWDSFVQWSIHHDLHGVENLSLIPGEVGAAAVQNIGAYGVEAKDVIYTVETVDLQTGELRTFRNAECDYGYRTSIFKKALAGRYAVTHVVLVLSHTFRPLTEYGGLAAGVDGLGKTPRNITAQELRNVVVSIRRSKLPDPAVMGNAGSFFTNPIVSHAKWEALHSEYPKMPHYEVDASHVKVPAGWLIEQCGWKGRKMGPAGVYAQQALVLVNLGGATGHDILRLCLKIQADVYERFGIHLAPEVNIIE